MEYWHRIGSEKVSKSFKDNGQKSVEKAPRWFRERPQIGKGWFSDVPGKIIPGCIQGWFRKVSGMDWERFGYRIEMTEEWRRNSSDMANRWHRYS